LATLHSRVQKTSAKDVHFDMHVYGDFNVRGSSRVWLFKIYHIMISFLIGQLYLKSWYITKWVGL